MSKILPDGTRLRAGLLNGFLSHYVLRDRCGRPGKGNECAIEAVAHRGAIAPSPMGDGSSPLANGRSEGLAGLSRRNFMVPVPRFATWEDFNDHLEAQCRKRPDDVLRGQTPQMLRAHHLKTLQPPTRLREDDRQARPAAEPARDAARTEVCARPRAGRGRGAGPCPLRGPPGRAGAARGGFGQP